MIRSATISDCLPIVQAIREALRQHKARQSDNVSHKLPSLDALADKIRKELDSWLVCESADPQKMGFFSFSNLGADEKFKRYRFPKNSIHIEQFAGHLDGETLLEQFRQLASYFQDRSILVCISAEQRNAYWAALKAEFLLLGECRLIVGTIVWLYLDRDGNFDEIQLKLKRAKLISREI